ncbi:MAG: S24 family peptidase [Muribaculaceae bacterium]|nr:S24 family peptidase [Muribaculaceae bacterium]
MNKVLKSIIALIDDWISINSWEDKNWHAPSCCVAAGDPAYGSQTGGDRDNLPPYVRVNDEQVETARYMNLIVDGSSMSPERISNGDFLLCTKIGDEERENLGYGEHVVVKTDKDYYCKKNKPVRFDYKLRRTICKVKAGETYEQLVERIESENLEDSIFLSANKKMLKEKFSESHKYYDFSKSMMLSATYRDGEIRYSFHPVSLIEYKADYVVSPTRGMNNTRKL